MKVPANSVFISHIFCINTIILSFLVQHSFFQATVLCDIVVMYVLKKGPFYRDKKYKYVTDDDAFQVSNNLSDPSYYLTSVYVQPLFLFGNPVQRSSHLQYLTALYIECVICFKCLLWLLS